MKKIDEGLKILLNTYWCSNGWKLEYQISKKDFEIARKEGYMFDYPEVESHQESLERLERILKNVSKEDVANAFLYSLSTRKLEYRSILGSYYFGKAIPKHTIYDPYNNLNSKYCYMCGWYVWKILKEPNEYELNRGLNIYNFERYKFGGVRHTFLNYVLFDLEQFLKLPKVKPTEQDKEILINILNCVNELCETDKAGKLRNLITKKKIIKSNKNELSEILNILGICGVLSSKEFPCYQERFVNEYQRDPVEHNNDFNYPINRWYAKDGVNKERFEKVFGFKYDCD